MRKLRGKVLLAAAFALPLLFCGASQVRAEEDVITLRVCNWEEYIDEGDWDPEEETIDLPSGDILGENSMVEDFEEWYYETYGRRVKVEYSCFGTNEELYNMLNIGDVYDLVCPSEYMIMKLMKRGDLEPYSEDFFDEKVEENYYIRGVSPFIREAFETHEINGETWSRYAAGYMWGVTGMLYNPEVMTKEEASTWTVLTNPKFYRQITIKDNVRDTMYSAVAAVKSELLLSEQFLSDPDYRENLSREMNDTSVETVEATLDFLQDTRDNAYSFETDSGKADMITGKVAANLQWSGDAVYAMDQAEEDGYYLCYAVPYETTDLYFDGWVMLKKGIDGDADRKHAAEAFVNYLSIPENAVRNMYYIGYTSCISGGDSNAVYEYLEWNYGAEEDEEDAVEYPVGYFFSGDNEDEDYILTVPTEQLDRQLGAQYPSEEVVYRSAIMEDFDEEAAARINQMWIDVRCFNVKDIPVWGWCLGAVLVCFTGWLLLKARKLN